MAEEFRVLGKPENLDKQSYLIVTGKMDFSADHPLPGKLYARILGCPYPHARVLNIDTSKAEAMEGVEAVCTHADCPIMVEEKLYWGQEVAAVAATDPHIAATALELIEVEYEELPFATDPEVAMQDGAPLVGTWPSGNVVVNETNERGDVDAGFAEADIVIEETVGWTPYHQHNNIEPRSSIAYWVGDEVYVWTCSQNPFNHRTLIRTIMGIPEHKIHLISHGTGVGSGDKTTQEQVIIAIVLAKKTGKPVEMHLSRREHMLNARHQFACKAIMKMGCKNDGTIVAMESEFYADVGSDVDPPGMSRAGSLNGEFRQNYKCPNLRDIGYNVTTNKPRTGYYRCVEGPPGNFLIDSLMERMAVELGMDPLEFRLMNAVTPELGNQDSGMPYSSMAIKECLEIAGDRIGWANKWHAPGTKTLSDGRLHGIGIDGAVVDKGAIMLFPGFGSGAIANVSADGKAIINVGISRVAGGTNTAMAHVFAEASGFKYEDVQVGEWGNTDVCSAGGGQNGSSRCPTCSGAYYNCGLDTKAQLLTAAVPRFGLQSADELDLVDSVIFVKANPQEKKNVSEITATQANPIIGRGYAWPANLRRDVHQWPAGTPALMKGMNAAAVEVAVDPETGEVEILNHVNVTDTGRTLFLKGAEGQNDGGLLIEQAQTLMYEQIYDHTNGKCLNPDFLNNKCPTYMDFIDDRCEGVLYESDDACGAFGCKGIGEPVITCYAAVANAINNAIGVWINDAPIYPQKILKALGKV